MIISALVAYRPTRDGHRDEAWRREVLPYLELVCDEVIVEAPEPAGDGGPDDFNKPAAINRARQRARGDVLLIADADTHPGDVPRMVELLERGAPWVLPERYVKLTREATHDWLYGPPRPFVEGDYEWVGRGVSWSAGVVCWAQGFDRAAGFDERFAQWGADDVAFAMCMNALVGPVERHPCACYHYWHPGADGRVQPQAQHDLMWLYLQAAETSPAAVVRVRAGDPSVRLGWQTGELERLAAR